MTTIQIPATDTATKVSTRTLLGCAAVAGPLWTVVSLAQAATREAFDLKWRHSFRRTYPNR